MPSVLIEVRQQYSPEQAAALIDAVHAALQEALNFKPGDLIIGMLPFNDFT